MRLAQYPGLAVPARAAEAGTLLVPSRRYNGNSGSRRALRRALVAAGEVVERVKLQRTEEA